MRCTVKQATCPRYSLPSFDRRLLTSALEKYYCALPKRDVFSKPSVGQLSWQYLLALISIHELSQIIWVLHVFASPFTLCRQEIQRLRCQSPSTVGHPILEGSPLSIWNTSATLRWSSRKSTSWSLCQTSNLPPASPQWVTFWIAKLNLLYLGVGTWADSEKLARMLSLSYVWPIVYWFII